MSRAQSVEALWVGIRNSSGDAVSGGKVYTYYAGTTTPVSLYSAQDKSAAATNPVILDSAGKAQVWADGAYKFVIKDSSDVVIDTIDNLIYGKIDLESSWGGNASGSSNAYTLSPLPAFTEYVNGQTVSFVANHTNSGASTLNISSLGAKAIKTGAGAALSSGAITSGNVVSVTYDSGLGYFILNTANSFTTITVTGSGTFGEVVSPILSNVGAIAVKPSGATAWNFSSSGHLVPETDDTVNIGSSSKVVRYGYIDEIFSSAVISNETSLSLGVGSATWIFNSSNHLKPATDAVYDIGDTTYRVRHAYCEGISANSCESYSGNPFYFGLAGDSTWCVANEGNLFPNRTSGTLNLGKSDRRLQDVYYGGRLNNGQTYSPGSYTALRTVTHPASGFLSGSDTVSRAVLEAYCQGIARLIATLIDDTVW